MIHMERGRGTTMDKATLTKRLENALGANDWSEIRASGEELLPLISEGSPPSAAANLHYLIADAILESKAIKLADLESACEHLIRSVGELCPASTRTVAYIKLA